MKGAKMKNKVRQLFADRETRVVYTFNGTEGNGPVDPTYAEDSRMHSMLMKFARGEVQPRQPFYADVSDFGDFRATQERVLNLRREFDKLPAAVRALMENDPAKFPEVVNDPRNREFLEKHGVLKQIQEGKEVVDSNESTTAGPGVQPQKGSKEPNKETQSVEQKN